MTPSEQARADAMADAETLRRNTAWSKMGPTAKAGRLGLAASRTHPTLPMLAYQRARDAARAAFRAVPGLREE